VKKHTHKQETNTPTYLDGEAGWQAQGDEITQLGEVGVGDGHEVDDGRHLLGQRQRVDLAQPQRSLEPAGGNCES